MYTSVACRHHSNNKLKTEITEITKAQNTKIQLVAMIPLLKYTQIASSKRKLAHLKKSKIEFSPINKPLKPHRQHPNLLKIGVDI